MLTDSWPERHIDWSTTMRTTSSALDRDQEPLRRVGYPAAVVAAVASLLGMLGLADTLDVQTILTAASVALGEFGLLAYGVEHARNRVRPESSHKAKLDQVIDAEYVIRGAQGDAPGDV